MSVSSLPFLTDAMLATQEKRIALQVRNAHLKRNGRFDPNTKAVFDKIQSVEEFIEELVAEELKEHPAYPWFSRVKGIGLENIAKVVGFVRVKPSDEFVCRNRECRHHLPKDMETEPPPCPKCDEQMSDPPFANSISALWKFAGYHVVDGAAPKRTRGQKLEYNSQLRTMCWRLGGSLMKARGKFFDIYLAEKERLVAQCQVQGIKIVPAAQLPKDKDGKHYEPKGLISEGHVHMRALRKMVKLFLAMLWLVWRDAEGLPTRPPYVQEKMGHTGIIDPWEMVDKPERKPRKTTRRSTKAAA